MKKNIIKVTLIAVVIIAIAGIAFFFLYGVSDSGKDVIVPQSLVSKIENRVSEEIVGKNYSEATKGYDSILDEIQTESFVKLADGKRYVSIEDETKCRRKAFDVYCKIYIEYAKSIFVQNSWNESTLPSIKEKAQQLQSTGFAEKGTEFDKDLKYCVTVVNDYFAAWRVVRSANNCNSISSVNNVRQSASSYMHAPLTNNSSLNSGLNQAFTNAKESYARYINSYCERVVKNNKNHSNYDGFLSDYNNASALIKGYKDNYGGESLFKNSESKLYYADQDAMKYFKELEEQKERERRAQQ